MYLRKQPQDFSVSLSLNNLMAISNRTMQEKHGVKNKSFIRTSAPSSGCNLEDFDVTESKKNAQFLYSK